MLINKCPVCFRYFPVGLWNHIQDCARREHDKAPHGYESFADYLKGIPAGRPEQEGKDATRTKV